MPGVYRVRNTRTLSNRTFASRMQRVRLHDSQKRYELIYELMSFKCPEHKCAKCKGTLEPNGHNRSDCPRMETTIKRTCFLDLKFTPCVCKYNATVAQGVASEARCGPLIVPKMVLEYSHRAATFRDFRGEASGSPKPCTFRSCGAESRPSAWCLRNQSQASGPQSFQRIGDN